MPLLKRRRILACKVEATPGTAESLAAADAAFSPRDVMVQPDISYKDRENVGFFAPLPGVLGQYAGSCSFEIDLIGGASDPLWATVFLPAFGWVDNLGTYSPATEDVGSNVKTLTVGSYQNGLLKKLRGAVGDFEITLVPGEVAVMAVTLTGIWDFPADSAILTSVAHPALVPPRFASGTCSVGGNAIKPGEVRIKSNHVIAPRLDPTDASGIANFLITGRRITVEADPESDLVANLDRHGMWRDGDQDALSLVWGSASNQITIAAPALQRENVQEADREGVQTDTTTYVANQSSGDDELTFAFA